MKVLMKPVEMIVWFTRDGVPTPIRYRMMENKENITVNVDRVILREEEKIAGNRMFVYRCQSNISGVERTFELKYEISTCRWFLYKV